MTSLAAALPELRKAAFARSSRCALRNVTIANLVCSQPRFFPTLRATDGDATRRRGDAGPAQRAIRGAPRSSPSRGPRVWAEASGPGGSVEMSFDSFRARLAAGRATGVS